MWDWVVVELLWGQLLLVVIELWWVCCVGVALRQGAVLSILRRDVVL